jgi:hypothetical protein
MKNRGNKRKNTVFVLLKIRSEKMEYFSKKLVRSEELEGKIRFVCSYSNSKYEIIEGHIIDIAKTNISFIEPHRVVITIKGKKLLVIYYDKDNMFLYNRTMPIDIKKLDTLLKHIKSEVL